MHRSEIAGCAEYGYRASHSRYFWVLRLHMVCSLHGLRVEYALTGAKTGECQVFMDILAGTAAMTGTEPTGAATS